MVVVSLSNSAFVKPGWVSLVVVKWAINQAMQRGISEPVPFIDDACKQGKLTPRDRNTFATLTSRYRYDAGVVNFAELVNWGHAAGYDFRIATKKNKRLENAITPTSGGSSSWRREVHRNAATAPEWVYWPAVRRVDSWQAISLSLGLDPDSLEHDGEFITAASFPTAEVQAEFEKRLALVSALTNLVCAPLSQFVALLGRLPMPPELAMLAAPAALDKPPETTPETDDESQNIDAAIAGAGGTAKPASQQDDSGASPACAVFREMTGLRPDEVTIEFAAGELGTIVLNISARDKHKRVPISEFDLFDKRGAKPNEQGLILLGLAGGRKAVYLKNKDARRISRLRQAIKKHLGLSADPFAPYNEGTGYEPLFALKDAINRPDQRAKRNAERHRESFDELQERGVQFADNGRTEYSYETEDDMVGDAAENWLSENDLSR